MRFRVASCSVVVFAVAMSMGQGPRAQDANVTRATLDNGLRVVIVRDSLAPVVTVEDNYIVGGDETPDGFPGMAHAQEHMSFRGCSGVSADQTAAIFAELGGVGNADTQQNLTQYYTTVPNADLEVALRLDAACMKEADDAASEWDEERGAIEQEVSRDLSDPIYKFQVRLNEDMFAGTPYAHDPLGTRPSFEATTGAMLKQFFTSWYVPNNAVLVVAGDVDRGQDTGAHSDDLWIHSAADVAGPSGGESGRQSSPRPSRSTAICRTRWRSSHTGCLEPTARTSRPPRSWPTCSAASARTSTRSCRRAKRSMPGSGCLRRFRKRVWDLVRESCPPAPIREPSSRVCAASWRHMRPPVCRRNWWTPPNAAKSPTPNSIATPFPIWRVCGLRPLRPKGGSRPTTTSRRFAW